MYKSRALVREYQMDLQFQHILIFLTFFKMKPFIVLFSYLLNLSGGPSSVYALNSRDCDTGGEIPEWHPPRPKDCKPRHFWVF